MSYDAKEKGTVSNNPAYRSERVSYSQPVYRRVSISDDRVFISIFRNKVSRGIESNARSRFDSITHLYLPSPSPSNQKKGKKEAPSSTTRLINSSGTRSYSPPSSPLLSSTPPLGLLPSVAFIFLFHLQNQSAS